MDNCSRTLDRERGRAGGHWLERGESASLKSLVSQKKTKYLISSIRLKYFKMKINGVKEILNYSMNV